MISLKEVNKKFGKLTALDNVTIALDKGKSYALIGPNGSGKTTLIKSILGMVIPSSGEIFVENENIKNHWRYREKIGYMPQSGHYPENIKIGQLFDMMRNIRGGNVATDEELIQTFQLDKIVDKRMHALSGGTRQKVSAALAFLFDAPILILDEPTAGLDPVSVEILKEKILREKEQGKLFLISSHILSDLDELSTDIVYLIEGKIEYQNSIDHLKEMTQERRLGRAMAAFINKNAFQHILQD
jgi:Cu-processing system ATP-binding protein